MKTFWDPEKNSCINIVSLYRNYPLMRPAAIKWLSVVFLALILTFSMASSPEGGSENKGGPGANPTPSIFIMGSGYQDVDQMASFMLQHNPRLDTQYIYRVLTTYIVECKREGINHDIAVCQMCLETGFLRFNGTVSRHQNNFCGLGAINTTTPGDWFGSMEEGVRAHIQHLKAYSSNEPLQTPLVDKRFHKVHRGTAFTIFDLTGRWATDPRYGQKIHYLLKILAGS